MHLGFSNTRMREGRSLGRDAGKIMFSNEQLSSGIIRINPQDDGNFVLYDGNGKNRALWCTRTEGGRKAPEHYNGKGHKLSDPLPVTNHLIPGGMIGNGQLLKSSNGRFMMRMQKDGNLVVYSGSNPIWASRTENKGCQPFRLEMQHDSNLCIYDGTGRCTWASQTHGCGRAGAWVEMQVKLQI